jgi:hypothetical protein
VGRVSGWNATDPSIVRDDKDCSDIDHASAFSSSSPRSPSRPRLRRCWPRSLPCRRRPAGNGILQWKGCPYPLGQRREGRKTREQLAKVRLDRLCHRTRHRRAFAALPRLKHLACPRIRTHIYLPRGAVRRFLSSRHFVFEPCCRLAVFFNKCSQIHILCRRRNRPPSRAGTRTENHPSSCRLA